MDQNQEIFTRYMNDKDFQRLVSEWMRKQVYDQVRAQPPDSFSENIGAQ
jgi:type I restriction enzyme R subunit